MLELLQVAPMSTVQDLGREGLRHLGIGGGGAMDPFALQRANALLGNAPGAAAIELCAGGLRLRCTRDAWFALQGAAFEMRIEGRLQPAHLRCRVMAGQELSLQGPQAGWFGVLAVDGGIALPPVLGARATALRGGFGGLDGRCLRAGDRLPLGAASLLQGRRGLAPPRWTPVLGLLPGPEFQALDADSRALLWRQRWRVTAHSDRMGLRLHGAQALHCGAGELLSCASLPGLVQLPPGGQPIVLAADAQTTGGYPRIGQLMAAERWKLAQLRPGDRLQFAPVDLDTARERWDDQQRELRLLRSTLGCPDA